MDKFNDSLEHVLKVKFGGSDTYAEQAHERNPAFIKQLLKSFVAWDVPEERIDKEFVEKWLNKIAEPHRARLKAAIELEALYNRLYGEG